MTFKEATEKYKIPVKALYALYNRDVIPLELEEEHEKILKHISYVWGKDIFLRMQLTKKSRQKREKIMTEADMNLNRIEIYIYNRYINSLQKGEKLSQHQILNEVKTYLRVPYSNKVIEMIRRMRKKAYNAVAKAKR